MADQEATITVELTYRWWLRPYLHMLIFFCWLHRTEPDWDKLQATIKRGTRVRVVPTQAAK